MYRQYISCDQNIISKEISADIYQLIRWVVNVKQMDSYSR